MFPEKILFMKNILTYTLNKVKAGNLLTYSLVVPLVLLFATGVQAQADSTSPAATEMVAAATSELIAPSLELIPVQKADRTIDCKVKMQAKVKGVFYKLPLLKVNIVHVTPAGEMNLGHAITDRNGRAVINVKGDPLVADAEGKVLLKAIYAGNKQMEPADAEVAVKRALLTVNPVVVDSVYTIQARLVDISTGLETPIPEAALGLFVKRSFFPLKIGEGTTDAAGEASIEVPAHLPGDAKHNITLIARLDENELYGNLEAAVEQPWGTTVSDANIIAPRALWSTRPPLWMVITFSILVTIVWGHYIVIIYELIRLRKEEPHNTPEIS